MIINNKLSNFLSNNNHIIWLYTILLILITSPSYSLVKGFNLINIYFPNEKIALLISTIIIFTSKELINELIFYIKKFTICQFFYLFLY